MVIIGMIPNGTQDDFNKPGGLTVSSRVDDVGALVFSHDFTSQVELRAKLRRVAF